MAQKDISKGGLESRLGEICKCSGEIRFSRDSLIPDSVDPDHPVLRGKSLLEVLEADVLLGYLHIPHSVIPPPPKSCLACISKAVVTQLVHQGICQRLHNLQSGQCSNTEYVSICSTSRDRRAAYYLWLQVQTCFHLWYLQFFKVSKPPQINCL